MIYFSVVVKECLQSETIYIFSIIQKKKITAIGKWAINK